MSGIRDNELRRLGEFGFIDAFTRHLRQGSAVEMGPGDDCAVVRAQRGRILLSTDASVEDIHFRRAWGARNVGWRAMAAALSDLAAMGAEPLAALASVALPPDLPDGYALDLCGGLAEAAAAVQASLVGGDVVRSPDRIFVDVHVVGMPSHGRILTRDAALPGDLVAVSGWPGRAAAGVAALERNVSVPPSLVEAVFRPEPRIALGMALAGIGGTRAAIDLSDGLLQDLGHVARRSGVCVRVESAGLPIHPDLEEGCDRLSLDPRECVLAGGEDYELAVTLHPAAWEAARAVADACGVPLWQVGTVTDGPPAVLVDGQPPAALRGFDHFG